MRVRLKNATSLSNIVPIREPKRLPGVRVPLFERLADEALEKETEHPIFKFYEFEELLASIERELYHVLGTQSKAKKEDYVELAKNPLNYALPEMYGVPEFTYFEASNKENWKPLAKHVAKIVEAYEPRLKNVKITIEEFEKQSQTLHFHITADLNVPEFQEEATFSLALKRG